jgi:hypothetical protein
VRIDAHDSCITPRARPRSGDWGIASTASADTGGYSGSDDSYYKLLTTGTDAMTVTNFPLLITQGQEACHRMAVGASELDAIDALMAEGPYSFVTANTIVSTAGTIYCNDDLKRGFNVDHRRLGVPELP